MSQTRDTGVNDTRQLRPLPMLDRDLLRQCVHCGFCLPACPTYRVLGLEADSPRGRIMQMKAVAQGDVPVDDVNFRTHMSRCLACRACETACPSGVHYGRLIESVRADLPVSGRAARLMRQTLLGNVFGSPTILEGLGLGMRLYQRSGAQRLLRASGALQQLPGPAGMLGKLEALMPAVQGPIVQQPLARFLPAQGTRQYRVAVVTGCVMNQFFRATNRSTAHVLSINGCDVLIPRTQVCCGAIHVHAGERSLAQELARRNIDAMLSLGVDAIIINAAGCGSTLKEYGVLLDDDADYAARARGFSRKVRDINEFLVDIGFRHPTARVPEQRVAYQDACHLAHAQRITAQPRALLRSIPGVTLVDMPNADYCCGSAGIYNITNYAMSMTLLEQKMESITATATDVIAAANPGCAIQIAAGARMRGWQVGVAHPIDLLDAAYQAESAIHT